MDHAAAVDEIALQEAEQTVQEATFTEERRLAEEDELACRLAAAAAAHEYDTIKYTVADKIMAQDNIEMAMAKAIKVNDMQRLRGEYAVAQVRTLRKVPSTHQRISARVFFCLADFSRPMEDPGISPLSQVEADNAIASVKGLKVDMIEQAEVYEVAKIRLHEALNTKEQAESQRLLPVAAKRYDESRRESDAATRAGKIVDRKVAKMRLAAFHSTDYATAAAVDEKVSTSAVRTFATLSSNTMALTISDCG